MSKHLAQALDLAEQGELIRARQRIDTALDLAEDGDDLERVVVALRGVLGFTDRGQQSERPYLETVLRQTKLRRDSLSSTDPDAGARSLLRQRLARLLKLVVHNDEAIKAADIQPLLSVIASLPWPWPEAVDEDVGAAHRAWGNVLFKGFERGREAAGTLALAPLADHHSRLVRELKKAAMHLIEVGAAVLGVGEDAVPLVAYALLAGVLPAGPRAENDELEDRLIDAMLRVADTSARLPAQQRLTFVAYYRLAFLLGLADGYAERLSISKLTFS